MAASGKLSEDLMKGIAPLIFETLGVIKEETPVDTGRLRNSIEAEQTDEGWIIGTNLDYAVPVEIGSPPHIIVPKTKKALRFEVDRKMRLAKGKSPKQANIVFAKKVEHPGTKAHHMFLKGVNYFTRKLPEHLKKI